MVTQRMETNGFVRPTLFLVGSKSRLGYTFTSIPSHLDDAAQPCTIWANNWLPSTPKSAGWSEHILPSLDFLAPSQTSEHPEKSCSFTASKLPPTNNKRSCLKSCETVHGTVCHSPHSKSSLAKAPYQSTRSCELSWTVICRLTNSNHERLGN